MSRLTFRLVTTVVLTAATSSAIAQSNSPGELTPRELFELRIMPIFKSPEPSSCVQCHLASVDLKEYILPSPEKTFASLRDQGLIDLEAPEKSKILTLIQMGAKDPDKDVQLIHENTRQAEYLALASWIEACCNDPKFLELPELDAARRAKPNKPDGVIRHARTSRVVDSFVRNVWSQRMRCFPCHTPYELDENNPRHQKPIENQKKWAQQYGEELTNRIRIFKETPEATLQYMIERSRSAPQGEIPLLNLEDPRNSLIVLKPTSKLPMKDEEGKLLVPVPGEPMAHMGGLKMHKDDQSYKSFIAWIQDYAHVVGNRYTSVEELPADNWYASKLVVKLTEAPTDWPVGMPVQLFVHAWNDKSESWNSEPIAFTQGTVTPRRVVNGALFLLAPGDSREAVPWGRENASLPRGQYLVKAYVDAQHRLAENPTVLLGDEEFVGQAEIKKARWREGFLRAEKVSANDLAKE